MIPMVDLKGQYQTLKDEINASIQDVLDNSHFILGPNVQQFEAEAADYLGASHAISCASGTDALHLALRAAGIGEGDEVITSAFTFIATAEAIRYVGAIPVFVDIDPQAFNLDPDLISAAITPKTKAILPVHLFGQPADMAAITALADQHNLLVIEDCAQSFGAAIDGQMTGSMSTAGCYSFFPSKNLGCYGDGGLITTQSDEIAKQLKIYRNHGSEVRYYHSVIGYNSRLDEIQAAILRIKLKYIDHYNTERRRAAHSYSRLLKESAVVTPHENNIGRHVYHQYTLLSDQRDDIMAALQKENIACAVYYPVPLHQQAAFADTQIGKTSLPVTENIASRCFSLPIYPELEENNIEKICHIIRGIA